MAYRRDLKGAARRHLQAADQLHPCNTVEQCRPEHRPDVAGYLYGVAAECALKAIMWDSGMREQGERRDDPYYLHFPELKTALRDRASGRFAQRIAKFARDDGLMTEWDVAMRYAGSAEVRARPIDRWKRQAHDLVREMEAWR